MKVLESFLINLGLKVDERSFKSGQTAFDGLTRSALQLGAVFASKFALDKVVTGFVDAGSKLDNFNKLTGVSVENVQKLDLALRKQGGAAGDAFNMLRNVQNLMASPLTGNTGWMGDAAKFGFDPNTIINAKSTEDAIEGIAGSFEKMSTIQRLKVGEALGLDDSQIRLLSKGRDGLEEYYKQAKDIGVLTQHQTEDAKALNEAMTDFDATISSIANRIGADLTPALTELVQEFVEFYKANKDWIDEDIDVVVGALAENIKLLAGAMLLLGGGGALKGLAVLRGIASIGRAGAAAGAAGSAAGAAGVGAGTIALGGFAALAYSSSLNSGEDEEIRKIRQGENTDASVPGLIKFFTNKGWTPEQAAGIVANLQQESNFDHRAVGDGGKAFGLAQWHPDRQANFKQWAGKDIRQASYEDQLNFINYELTQGTEQGAGKRLRGATSAEDAGAIVSRYYERPKAADDEANMRGDRAASYGVGKTVNDNRTITIHTNDEGMVRKVLREELGDMADQTLNDLGSSEK